MKRVRVAWIACILTAVVASAQEGALDTAPLQGTTPEQIIKKFAAREKEFKNVRKRCTYRQTIKMQGLDGDKVMAEYQQVADVTLDDKGNKVKNVVFAPQPSMFLSPEDAQDLESRLHFTLSSDELPEYNVLYKGKQSIDELHVYVFDVAPRQFEKGKRYFQGKIWVDDHDFQIVKMEGKAAPDIYPKKRKGEPNLFPKYTTYREQIDGKFWYPTYSYTDDTLHFPVGEARIKGTVKASNYRCADLDLASNPPKKPEKPEEKPQVDRSGVH